MLTVHRLSVVIAISLHITANMAIRGNHPAPVDNLHCRVYDWEILTCTWDLSTQYTNSDRVEVELIWDVLKHGYKCPHLNETSCVWKEHDGRYSFQMGKIYYIIIIVRTYNEYGTKVTEAKLRRFEIDTLLIVKPSPVLNLTVVDRNSSCISLSWNHSRIFRTTVCRIHVHPRHHKVYHSIKEKTQSVCGLHPGRKYRLKVSCIPFVHDKPRGTYSDWTAIDSTTLEDIPSGVPESTAGSYTYNMCTQTMCTVTIHWKPVPENDCNGEITHYMVKQTDIQSREEREFEVKGYHRSIKLELKKHQEYLIQLNARTSVGYSSDSSSLVIRPLQYRLPYPSDFLVEAHENTLHITWGPPKESWDTPQGRKIGYTLYYCNGSKFTFRCLDEINWIHFSNETSTFDLDVPKKLIERTMIGISFDTDIANRKTSSGILWNLCTYYSRRPPKLRNVHFSKEQPDDGLRVQWDKFDCATNPVYVTQYVLRYCRLSSQEMCADASENLTLSNTEASHVIKDLEAGVSYKVMVYAISKAGAGPESDPIVMEVINSDLKSGYIVLIVIGSVIVFIIILTLSILLGKKVHKIKKEFFIFVDVPSVTLGDPDSEFGDKNNNSQDTNSVSSRRALLQYNVDKEGIRKGCSYLDTLLGDVNSPPSEHSSSSKDKKTKKNVAKGSHSPSGSRTIEKSNVVDSYSKFGNTTDSQCLSRGSNSFNRSDRLNLVERRSSQIPTHDCQVHFASSQPPLFKPGLAPAPIVRCETGVYSKMGNNGTIIQPPITQFCPTPTPAHAHAHAPALGCEMGVYSKMGNDGKIIQPTVSQYCPAPAVGCETGVYSKMASDGTIIQSPVPQSHPTLTPASRVGCETGVYSKMASDGTIIQSPVPQSHPTLTPASRVGCETGVYSKMASDGTIVQPPVPQSHPTLTSAPASTVGYDTGVYDKMGKDGKIIHLGNTDCVLHDQLLSQGQNADYVPHDQLLSQGPYTDCLLHDQLLSQGQNADYVPHDQLPSQGQNTDYVLHDQLPSQGQSTDYVLHDQLLSQGHNTNSAWLKCRDTPLS